MPIKSDKPFTDKFEGKVRPLKQFRDSWIKQDLCYKKRIGGEVYTFPKDYPIVEERDQKYHTGIPICEAHLKLSQRLPQQKKTNNEWVIGKNRKWSALLIVNILLAICAEEIGLSFFLLADPWLNFAVDVVIVALHFWLYNPYLALISLIGKAMILVPNASIGLIIGAAIPFHYITILIGYIQRRTAKKQLNFYQSAVKTFYKGKTNLEVYQLLYPQGSYNWNEKGADSDYKLIKMKKSDFTQAFDKPSKAPKTTSVVASRIQKRFQG